MFNVISNILDKFQIISSLNVAYDSGDSNKTAIVLLHGIAATSKSYENVIDIIDKNKFRVIAIDLLGFGDSPKPVFCKYSVDDHVASIHKTLNELHIKTPIILIGHSMGSIISARYCNRYPKNIQNVFLLSLPLYIKNKELNQTIISAKQTDAFLRIYNYMSLKKNITIKFSQKIRKLLRLSDGMDVNEENWFAFKQSLRNTVINQNTYSDIKDIKIPVNIIYGSLDNFVVQKTVDKLADIPNVCVTKVAGSHHMIDKKFAAAIADQISVSCQEHI